MVIEDQHQKMKLMKIHQGRAKRVENRTVVLVIQRTRLAELLAAVAALPLRKESPCGGVEALAQVGAA